MFHRSERLLLRPVWPEDWRSVYTGIADEGVVRNLASAPWPYAEEDARQWVALPQDPMLPKFLATRAADGELIGCIGVNAMEEHANAIELGYWIARPFWGQGYATEAGRGVIEVARVLGHRTIIASHFLDNPASGAVLRKLGFEPTGSVDARHSCGRGEKALAAEYALDLVEEMAFSQATGPAGLSAA